MPFNFASLLAEGFRQRAQQQAEAARQTFARASLQQSARLAVMRQLFQAGESDKTRTAIGSRLDRQLAAQEKLAARQEKARLAQLKAQQGFQKELEQMRQAFTREEEFPFRERLAGLSAGAAAQPGSLRLLSGMTVPQMRTFRDTLNRHGFVEDALGARRPISGEIPVLLGLLNARLGTAPSAEPLFGPRRELLNR